MSRKTLKLTTLSDESRQRLSSIIKKNSIEYSVLPNGSVIQVDREFSSKRAAREMEAKQRL